MANVTELKSIIYTKRGRYSARGRSGLKSDTKKALSQKKPGLFGGLKTPKAARRGGREKGEMDFILLK
jgi:hypothetical protein